MKTQIFIKAWFSDWNPVSRELALKCARHRFNSITVGSQEEKLALTNKHLKGIEFTLEELRCPR